VSARLRIVIVTEEPGWHGAELRRALEARDAEVCFVSLRECRLELMGAGAGIVVPGFADRLPDGVMVRDVPGGSLEQVVLRLDLLHALRELGVPVYNDARAIERTVDKGMTSLLLQRACVPTPPTCVTEALAQAQAFLRDQTSAGHEVVVKPLFGSLGAGLRRLAAGADLPGEPEVQGVWYLQRYVETGAAATGRHDWRVLVVAGRAVAAMIRRGGDWIGNVARGARCEPAPLDAGLARLSIAAAAAVGADHAGVDLVRDREGSFLVLEVNGIPGWKGLQSVTPIDLAGRVADDFLSRRIAGESAVAS
jgi:tetrahydromethanopterin:alpha-L-glutamate ligase